MQHAPSLYIEPVDFVGRFSRMVENLRLNHKRAASYRKTMKELNKLNDRELADIGLSRGDIAEAARRGAAAL